MEIFLKYKYYLLGILIYSLSVASLIIFLFWIFTKEEPITQVKKTNIIAAKTIAESEKCFVDIKGVVKNPGVYSLDCHKLVNDALTLAGGVKSYGTTSNINLSKQISQGMVIRIFNKKDLPDNNVLTPICQTNEVIINNCEQASIIEDSNSPSTTENNDSSTETNQSLVSINTATKDTLMTLSGIGEAKALSIIQYRLDNGLFKKIEDIMNVSGIGEAIFAKIKAFITI